MYSAGQGESSLVLYTMW